MKRHAHSHFFLILALWLAITILFSQGVFAFNACSTVQAGLFPVLGYDGQTQVQSAYDDHFKPASSYDGARMLALDEKIIKPAACGSPFAKFARLLAAEETGAANTFFHYTQAEIPAGQGLNVGSGVTSVGNLNAQQAMLNFGIDPPKFVYPVTLENPLDYLTIDVGTPARNTIPSWSVIQQTPPGSVGAPVIVPRGP